MKEMPFSAHCVQNFVRSLEQACQSGGTSYYFTAEEMQALRVRFASQLSDYSSCAVPITPTQGAPPCVLPPCYMPPVKLGSGHIPLPGAMVLPFHSLTSPQTP